MNKKTAFQLATDLLGMMRAGDDARAQIDFICNHMRIKKKEAAFFQNVFESGIRAGCDSEINEGKDISQENNAHPLYIAAYHVGREDFKIKLEEQRCKDKPEKIVNGYGLIISIVLVLAIIFVVLLIRF